MVAAPLEGDGLRLSGHRPISGIGGLHGSFSAVRRPKARSAGNAAAFHPFRVSGKVRVAVKFVLCSEELPCAVACMFGDVSILYFDPVLDLVPARLFWNTVNVD